MAKTVVEIRLASLEKVVREGMETFRNVGEALAAIRDEKLYRPEFRSFADYCRTRWDLSPASAYRSITQAKVAAALPAGMTSPSQRASANRVQTSRARDVSTAEGVRSESTARTPRKRAAKAATKAATTVEAPTRDVDDGPTPRLLVGTVVRALGALDPLDAYRSATTAQRRAIAAWARRFLANHDTHEKAVAVVAAHRVDPPAKPAPAKAAAAAGRREVTPMFKEKHRAR